MFSTLYPSIACERSARRLSYAWIALSLSLSAAAIAPAAAADSAGEAKPKTVSLAIDYGDGVEIRFSGLPWREEMTVLDACKTVEKHAHGVAFVVRGSGKMAFVAQIGDLKNEGGGEQSRNWIYRVNGKPADVGIGAFTLKPADAVLWKFDKYDYNRSQ